MLNFHNLYSLTVMKDGCIDQILLFKKEKSGIGLVLRFSCLQFENCVNAVFCSFFFDSCDDFSITSQRIVNTTQGWPLC